MCVCVCVSSPADGAFLRLLAFLCSCCSCRGGAVSWRRADVVGHRAAERGGGAAAASASGLCVILTGSQHQHPQHQQSSVHPDKDNATRGHDLKSRDLTERRNDAGVHRDDHHVSPICKARAHEEAAGAGPQPKPRHLYVPWCKSALLQLQPSHCCRFVSNAPHGLEMWFIFTHECLHERPSLGSFSMNGWPGRMMDRSPIMKERWAPVRAWTSKDVPVVSHAHADSLILSTILRILLVFFSHVIIRVMTLVVHPGWWNVNKTWGGVQYITNEQPPLHKHQKSKGLTVWII